MYVEPGMTLTKWLTTGLMEGILYYARSMILGGKNEICQS